MQNETISNKVREICRIHTDEPNFVGFFFLFIFWRECHCANEYKNHNSLHWLTEYM